MSQATYELVHAMGEHRTFIFEGGKVNGCIVILEPDWENAEKNSVAIYEWSSRDKEQGNTVRALRYLKERFKTIEVYSVERYSPAQRYWLYMKEKGLVDFVFDEEYNIIEQP